MVDTTIFNKLSLIFNFIKDNSLIGLVLLLIGLLLLDLLYGKNKKETKTLYIIVMALSLVYIFIIYNKPLLNILDIYITNIFRLSYFPSIIEYFTFILLTIVIQIISIKKANKVVKNINIWVGFIIEILFIINIVAMNGITVDLKTITSIYENDLLLSIFQISSILFMLWLIMNLLILIVDMFLKNRVELPKLNADYEDMD